jgi:ankyrin repeat protein
MRIMVRNLLLPLVIAALIGEALVLILVPDEIMVLAAAARWNENDLLSVVLPEKLARAKLKLSGFKSCELDSFGPAVPVASFLTAAYTEPNSGRLFLRSLFDKAIKQGCEIDAYSSISGLTSLHEAILFNDLNLVDFLMNKGANPYQKIKRPGTAFDGKNGVEMIGILEKITPQVKREEVKKRLTVISTVTPVGAR